jgi:DnaK suppressor protein
MTAGEQRTQRLKDLLLSKRKEILAEVRRSMDQSLDEDVRLTFEIMQDNADKSVGELNKYIDAAILGNKADLLDAIDSALLKLKEGSYGTCEECGAEIPLGRLRAMPSATRCVECQEQLDKQKGAKNYWEEHTDVFKDSPDTIPDEG